MTHLVRLCLLSLLVSSLAADEWRLSWTEDFDQDGEVNPAVWNYRTGYVANEELQWYLPGTSNVIVEDGMLVITAKKERIPNPNYDPDAPESDWKVSREYSDYTSGRINTRGKKEFQYGRLEVRAKIPKGLGMWPAIWMLGGNIKDAGWPECGEIDIMEFVGFQPNKIHANIHTEAFNHKIRTNKGDTITVEKPWEDFHVYTLEWTPSEISMFFDDQKYFTFEKKPEYGEAEWPFDQPFFLIFNIAVGGVWGGRHGVDDSIFPQQMKVDWVRYYEKPSGYASTERPAKVFEEVDGVLTFEAEDYSKQELTGVRAWHLTTADITPGIKPDPDPNHAEGASGGAYLEILPDTRANHGEKLVWGENFTNNPGKMAILHYPVYFNNPGKYWIWARAYSTGTEDNGIHFGINGEWPETAQRWQTTQKRQWHWESRQRTADVHHGVKGILTMEITDPGPHTLMISMREDGFELDKVLLVNREDYEPGGMGPEPVVMSNGE